MATLEQIVASVAARVDQPFNVDLQEELKHIVNYKRANYTQQFISKNPGQRKFFLQKLIMELEKVPADECKEVDGCIIMRTKEFVPTPIRNNTTIFDFVGDSNFINGYGYQEPDFIQDTGFNRFTKKRPKWYFMNKKIYIYNTTTINRIGIRGVFEDPVKVPVCDDSSEECNAALEDYPIASDLLNSIVRDILQVEFRQKFLPEEEVEMDALEEMQNRGMSNKQQQR